MAAHGALLQERMLVLIILICIVAARVLIVMEGLNGQTGNYMLTAIQTNIAVIITQIAKAADIIIIIHVMIMMNTGLITAITTKE